MSFDPILPKLTICYGGQAPTIPKVATQDTVLTVNKVDGGKTTFPVQAGMGVDIHVPGLHYNRTLSGFCIMETSSHEDWLARYWKDPHRFIPERFLGDWPKEAFLPFSQGMSFPPDHCNLKSRTLCRCPCLFGETVRGVVVQLKAESSQLSFRFFETEGIAIMTMLVSRYKIEVKEEPEFAGETFEERYARVTAFDQGITTT